MPQERPLPVVHPDNAPFWEHLKKHRLHLQRCGECGMLRYPVSPVCPDCLSEEHSWEAMSGRGRLVTAVVVQRATGGQWWSSRTPFAVALVQLDEGPRLKGGMDPGVAARLKPGDAVRVGFEDVDDGIALLRFEPDD